MERRIIDLSNYRFGCCYYSIFHGMRAVNALDGFFDEKGGTGRWEFL